MNKKWFVIVNPTSGNGASIKKWPLIFNELKQQQFNFEFVITTHKYHAENLVQNAINKGFKSIKSLTLPYCLYFRLFHDLCFSILIP